MGELSDVPPRAIPRNRISSSRKSVGFRNTVTPFCIRSSVMPRAGISRRPKTSPLGRSEPRSAAPANSSR